MACMLASTFCTAFASGKSSGATSSGDFQLVVLESGVVDWGRLLIASMRRGTMRAANMSPVPEKKRGRWGVVMRKRRGVCVDVDVEPIIVRFFAFDFDDEGFGVVQVEGWEVAGS